MHVDVDVLDPAVMPAVDAPDPGGIAYAELELLIGGLVSAPRCFGMELTVFDPDYDLDGTHAAALVDTLVVGMRPLLVSDEDSSPKFATVPVARKPSDSPLVVVEPSMDTA